jgi:hypothetical protein
MESGVDTLNAVRQLRASHITRDRSIRVQAITSALMAFSTSSYLES